ncbi:MAG: histidine kinase [Eubacteriales bacterium]|nr:histidine kinase [Eubacteriales bacterium]
MTKWTEWWNGTKLGKKFRDTRLTKKMMLIYVIFVLLPGILTLYLMNTNYYSVLWEKYYRNADEAFRKEAETVELRLNDISKISAHFTSNSVLMDYMGTAGMSVADSAYDYMKYFKTIFQIAGNTSPYVTSMTVYTKAAHEFEMTGQLENLEEDSVPEEVLKTVKGSWQILYEDGTVQLTYYEPIYTIGYHKFLGVLKICVDPALVMNCFLEERIGFYSEEPSFLIEKVGETFQMIEQEETKNSRFVYVSERRSEQLNGTFLTTVVMPEDFLQSFLVVLLPSFLMLLILPFIYISMMRRQMRRIENLSAYIDRNHTANPQQYEEKPESNDEIGTLIKVYNHNISEISRLSKEVDLAELQRKDSEFYALQAQIKPHFLYNTLENIRMAAVQEQDLRTASMLEILGNYMRYGLQKDRKYTLLVRELQHVKHYQQLMDIRFPGEIQMTIAAFADISEVSCPYLILQPIIENALKHGMEPGQPIEIRIEIHEASLGAGRQDVKVCISNNGRKIPEERLKQIQDQLSNGVSDEDGHVGLNNINFRLISCYGREYFMRVENGEEAGCRMVIYLPARNDI